MDAVVDLLEILEDTSSVADPVEVVVFRNDRDAVHYKLRWGNALYLIDNIWTIPPGTSAISWIAENAPDSDRGEWVSVWFPSAKRRERFWSALMQATATLAPDDGSIPKSDDETRPHGAVSSLSSPE